MKIIIKNRDAVKKVYINGIDFDQMTEKFQLEQVMEIIDTKELKSVFLNIIKEKDFDINKSQDENGAVMELWRKEKK